jgi:glycerol uptake facilitator-like aquaporin
MSMVKRLYVGVGAILGLVALLLSSGIYRLGLQQDHAAEVSDVGKMMSNSPPPGDNPRAALLTEIIAGFILVVACAAVITSRLARSLPSSEQESFSIHPR